MPTVLITGAASGIGRAAARLFARSGWCCVLVDRDKEGLQLLVDQLPGTGHAVRHVDLTDPVQIAGLGQGLPPLDALVNNAGLSDDSGIALTEQPSSQVARLMALNLDAPAAVFAACSPLLQSGARIVNVASGAGLRAIPWRGAYSASKAGLIAHTLALAGTRPDLCVTVLCPGFVQTELVEGLIQSGRLSTSAAVAKIPLGRMALPEELAQAMLFLCSDGALSLHGSVLSVDGGSSVFGGSSPLVPTPFEILSLDLPLQLDVVGLGSPWRAIAPARARGPTYVACLDASPLDAEGSDVLHAVHEAAARFASLHRSQASLILLLPTRNASNGRHAGAAAAARMLVATLACEWGNTALRINALEIEPSQEPLALQALVHFIAGARSQYLTGQTLVCHAGRKGAAE